VLMWALWLPCQLLRCASSLSFLRPPHYSLLISPSLLPLITPPPYVLPPQVPSSMREKVRTGARSRGDASSRSRGDASSRSRGASAGREQDGANSTPTIDSRGVDVSAVLGGARTDIGGGAMSAGDAGPLVGASLDVDAEQGMGPIHRKQERAGQRRVV
jgi:hypothetical protein